MENYLGIDYGEKRIGLSFGDDLGLAVPLPAAVVKKKEDRLRQIGEVIQRRKITQIILGHPINMDGSIGFKAKEVETFATLLKERFALPIHLVDERLSSRDAESRLREQNKKISRQSGELDSAAATIILQDYLNSQMPLLIADPFDDDDE